jgi:two-component system chemotaxis response regulator CheB
MPAPGEKIRVLVVDDSALAREMIREILEAADGIEVVGEACDGNEAVAMAAQLRPDLVTMDIEMPVMGGLEAIERIIAQNPLPILAVTALTGVRTAFAAVSKGALDVIEKPDISPHNMQALIRKIRMLARVDVAAHLAAVGKGKASSAGAGDARPTRQGAKGRVVAIAASTGGPQAIFSILSRLPADFPAPIVISQHMAQGFTRGMAEWLNGATPLAVSVAANGELLSAGRVYVNPAEHCMRISGQGMVILGECDPRLLYRPSCNTLLDSVASAYGSGSIGLILSGMGNDGVAGMQAVKKAGGATLAQDAGSSVIFGMNKIAAESGCIDRLLPLLDIPSELLLRAGGA